MVRALLDGSKTQTRRIAKPRRNPSLLDGSWTDDYVLDPGNREWLMRDNPYGQPGDRLWVRETWKPRIAHSCGMDACDCDTVYVHYSAGGEGHYFSSEIPEEWAMPQAAQNGKSVPSLHMPRWASRIQLEITSVRVERLQDISEGDAVAEGTPRDTGPGTQFCRADARNGYQHLWESIYGAGSWDTNPWVWVVEFRRAEP